jgi:predicted RNA binding protein YcfA (HicA-like mRNA interferase family)
VPLKIRDVIKVLEKYEWRHMRTNGDHRIYRSADGRITVVSGKLSDDNSAWYVASDLEADWY